MQTGTSVQTNLQFLTIKRFEKGNRMSLESDLRTLLNVYSRENESDTPDYILSMFMVKCLNALEKATTDRDAWWDSKSSRERK